MTESDSAKNNPTLSPRNRRQLFIGGLVAVAGGPIVHLFEFNEHAGWSLMILGLIFMAASRFEDVVEFGFGSFKARLERRVSEVEQAMSAVRRLAKESARNALLAVQYNNRLGSFDVGFQEDFLNNTRALLRELGLKDEDISYTEREWHLAVEFDYVLWATGNNRVPDDLPDGMHTAWKELRSGGTRNRKTPDDVRTFLLEADMLTEDREEILSDYQHYLATRQHRRSEEFKNRRNAD